jgi:hypothetical protein
MRSHEVRADGIAALPDAARPHRQGRPHASFALVAATLLALAGCGGGSGPATTPTPDTQPAGVPGPFVYTGPAPASADVQRFKVNVYDVLAAENRCGQCHREGVQAPFFVRRDDVNLAYEAANPLVDLALPAQSQLVTKVASGHNCWLSSPAACGDVVTRLVAAWAGEAASGGRVIQLAAPPLRDPGNSRSFPVDSTAFAASVHPLLTQFCSNCHTESAAVPQSPFFATADADVAYAAARAKIDLDTPANSRLVVRLGQEFHNCWSDCTANATAMRDAITAFAGTIVPTQVDPALVTSKALSIRDGVVASGGNRHEANLVALWEFKTGSGTTAFDTSGVAPAMDLTLSGDVTWVGGWGIRIANGGRAQASTSTSRKLRDLLTATGEFSIEAWVAPANVVQEGPARIISYSGSTTARNFTLGQTQYNYDFLLRSSRTDINGEPALSTADADEDLQATLQHVVVTYDPTRGRRIYVNGVFTGDADAGGGSLAEWDDSFAFVLGNEVSGNRPWAGTIRMVAVHSRALTDAQIVQNFEVGVGERFFLLFSIADVIGVPSSYVLFGVSQFDSYAYLFEAPRLVVLGAGGLPGDVPIEGMRIGLNGREVGVGQAYATLDMVARSADYDPAEGIALSDIGTIVALDKGPDSDQFFLTFERLGSRTNVFVEPVPPTPAPPPDAVAQPDIGVRVFSEIDTAMSAVTTVPATTPAVRATYRQIEQQLPTVETLGGFLASHQMAVTQLAIEYCNALVETPALATPFFTGFDLDAPVSTAFSPAGRAIVVDRLSQAIVGAGLGTQPSDAELADELNALIDRLTTCGAACPADRTRTVVKASCAAVLGSAALTLQ